MFFWCESFSEISFFLRRGEFFFYISVENIYGYFLLVFCCYVLKMVVIVKNLIKSWDFRVLWGKVCINRKRIRGVWDDVRWVRGVRWLMSRVGGGGRGWSLWGWINI